MSAASASRGAHSRVFHEPADSLARHEELPGECVGERFPGTSATRENPFLLVAVEQCVSQLVCGGEAASPRRHVEVDQQGEADLQVVQEGAGGGLAKVFAERGAVDGDAEHVAHWIKIGDRPRSQTEVVSDLFGLATDVILVGVPRAGHKRALGHPTDGHVHQPGQLGVASEKPDELADPWGRFGVDSIIGPQHHARKVDLAGFNRTNPREDPPARPRTGEPSASRCRSFGSPRARLPVGHHGPTDAQGRPNVVLGEAGPLPSARESQVEVAHRFALLSTSVLRRIR